MAAERKFEKARAHTDDGLRELIKHVAFCVSVFDEFLVDEHAENYVRQLAESVAIIEKNKRPALTAVA
jgi:hypothetical protein